MLKTRQIQLKAFNSTQFEEIFVCCCLDRACNYDVLQGILHPRKPFFFFKYLIWGRPKSCNLTWSQQPFLTLKSKVLTEDHVTADLEQDLLCHRLQSISCWMHPTHMLKHICFHLTLLQITELPPQLRGTWQQVQEEKKISSIAYVIFFDQSSLRCAGIFCSSSVFKYAF